MFFLAIDDGSSMLILANCCIQLLVLVVALTNLFLNNSFVLDEQGYTLTVVDDKGYDPYEEDYHKWLDRCIENLEKRHKSMFINLPFCQILIAI